MDEFHAYAVINGEVLCPTITASPFGWKWTDLPAAGGKLDGFEYFVPNPVDEFHAYALMNGEVLCPTTIAFSDGWNAFPSHWDPLYPEGWVAGVIWLPNPLDQL